MKGRFYRGDFFFIWLYKRERFIIYIYIYIYIYIVLLGVLWVLETLGVLGKHAHKEAKLHKVCSLKW